MKKKHLYDGISIAVLLIIAVISPLFYFRLPSVVPTHWGLYGQPDGWGPSWFAAFFFPLIIIAIYLLLTYIPRIDPKKERYTEFSREYGMFKVTIILFLAVLYVLTSFAGMGYAVKIDVVVPLMVGILFVTLGNYFDKIKSNWFFGIRTPWTLSSESVWNKTHKLGSRLFVLGGIIIALGAFLPAILKFVSFLVVIGVLVIVPMIYSYVLYKKINR